MSEIRPSEETVMMLKRTASLPFAAACLIAIATMPAHAQPAGTYGAAPGYTTPPGSAAYGATPGQQPYTPQASPADVPQSAAARQNVIESRQYDRELETNRAFRQARMRKECGPISDPELRQSCLASFNHDEPSVGSSGSSRARRSGSGR